MRAPGACSLGNEAGFSLSLDVRQVRNELRASGAKKRGSRWWRQDLAWVLTPAWLRANGFGLAERIRALGTLPGQQQAWGSISTPWRVGPSSSAICSPSCPTSSALHRALHPAAFLAFFAQRLPFGVADHRDPQKAKGRALGSAGTRHRSRGKPGELSPRLISADSRRFVVR